MYSVFDTCADELYHYTSIETLALILKNKTLRFNRLDRVNDPREAISKEYAAAQTIVFASCWTDSAEESIPLWRLYAGFSGVRICLPTLFFNGRHNNHKATNDDRLYHINVDEANYHIERRGSQYSVMAGSAVHGPTKIRYCDDAELAHENVSSLAGSPKYDLRRLGTQKHRHWKFEQEVRFRVLATFDYALDDSNPLMTPESFVTAPVITEFVDLPIAPSALGEMQILLGPSTTPGHRLIVEALLNQYAPTATLSSSAIQLRLKAS